MAIKIVRVTVQSIAKIRDIYFDCASTRKFLFRLLSFLFSMKSVRPVTAPKDGRIFKKDAKQLIPGYKRPQSAKTHSLKQIIQVI